MRRRASGLLALPLAAALSGALLAGDEISKPPQPQTKEEAMTLASIRALSHENPKTRAAAAMHFVNFPDSRAVDALVLLLDPKKETDMEVRMNAARALGEIGDPKAYEPIVRTMQTDPSRQVQWVAVISVGKIRDPRNFEQLRTIVKTDERLDWRHIAVYAIGYTGNKAALELLTGAIAEPDMPMRRDAARGLAVTKDAAACPIVLGRVELETTGEAMRAMIDALVALECKDAIPLFERMKKKLAGVRGEFDRIDRDLDEAILLLEGKDPGALPAAPPDAAKS